MTDGDESSYSLPMFFGSSQSSLLSSKDLSQSSSDLSTNKEKAKKFPNCFSSPQIRLVHQKLTNYRITFCVLTTSKNTYSYRI